jgi:hypothetical protein
VYCILNDGVDFSEYAWVVGYAVLKACDEMRVEELRLQEEEEEEVGRWYLSVGEECECECECVCVCVCVVFQSEWKSMGREVEGILYPSC